MATHNHLSKHIELFVDSMAKETFVEFADVYEDGLLHLRGIMRNARRVFVWRLSREAIATSIIYQLGAKSDLSEMENKFIRREERVLKSLESRIKTQYLTC